jgi:hypothetical protein
VGLYILLSLRDYMISELGSGGIIREGDTLLIQEVKKGVELAK